MRAHASLLALALSAAAAAPAQQLPAVDVRTVPQTALRYAVQLPPQSDAARWSPLVAVFADGDDDDAARAAVSRLADVARAGFVVVAPVRAPVRAPVGTGGRAPLFAHLRRTFRVEQGGMHALLRGTKDDVELLLAQRQQFQTITLTAPADGAQLAALQRLPARRLYQLAGAGELAGHFQQVHAERALPGVAGDVARVLDDFHDAAANGDEQRYFAILADDAVFLGTDGTERWTGAGFRAQMGKYFERDSAWTYVALRRHVDVAPGDQLAWFDEVLDNEAYGECRGSGVLARRDGRWVLRQYHLTVPVPNDLARDVAAQIRAFQDGAPQTATTIVLVRHAEKASDDPDTELSAAGRARADALARVLRDLPFTAAYSSGLRRTAATIAPACAARGVRSTTIRSPAQTVAELRAHRGGHVLVCGHSNTVPEILKGLGVADPVAIADDEYDRLFVVTLGRGEPRVLALRY